MASSPDQVVEALRRSLADNERLRQENAGLRADGDEPIAIVGMACRFPGGVDSPEALWALLGGDDGEGTDAVGPWPTDRGWTPDPDAPGGAFLDDVAGFDAGFFGISPREALAMDPQQRLVLEASWHALEDMGVPPTSLRGTRTGVFVGASNQEYGSHLVELSAELGGHVLTGNTLSVASGRLAYVLGTEGPALTVDTACSSSLVAMHLAAAALRAGECDTALAGGVTVMSTSDAFAEFSRQGGLAADGRCKAFSDDADGTGWGEGVGVVVLERLSVARAAGRRILAVLRGSAVNSDGASNGLTAPNGPAQQRVIRDALASGGLTAAEVDAVEAHGTGTTLGDPIEAQALLATYGAAPDRVAALVLGSVKSNLGHTQAAAGVAGVIKTVLALSHGRVPATLHADTPSSRVAWGSGAVELASSAVDLPSVERPWRIGVSSFGISGTNAHLVVEAVSEPGVAGAAEVADPPAGATRPWRFSARDPLALARLAGLLASHLADGTTPSDTLAAALDHRRPLLPHRAVVLPGDLDAGLRAVADRTARDGVVVGSARRGSTGVVLPGQGSQRPGMGRALADAFPVFGAALDAAVAAVDAALGAGEAAAGGAAESARLGSAAAAGAVETVSDGQGSDGLSLRAVMWAEESDENSAVLARTEWAQPALFAVQVAGFRLLESWGLEPGVLVGHSVGEIAAAHLSGALSLEDAARLVVARGQLMGDLPEGGSMAAVSGSSEALEAIELPDSVAIAARNSATSVVLSGETEALEQVLAGLADSVRVQRLRTSHAFHSPLMAPATEALAEVAGALTWHAPSVRVISTVTGAEVGAETWADPQHWATQLTAPVAFADAITAAHAARWVELGEKPSLTGHIAGDHPETPTTALGTDGHTAAATLWATGAELPEWLPTTDPGHVDLPLYPFTHERFWPATSGTEDGPVLREQWVPIERPEIHELGAVTVVGADDDLRVSAVVTALEQAGASVTSIADPATLPAGLTPVVAVGPGTESALALLQATAAPVVAVLTDTAHDPEQAAVAALFRSAAAEQPQRRLATVDLADRTAAETDSGTVAAAVLAAPDGESDLAVTTDGLRARRLVHAPVPAAPGETDWSGTTLITGGTGALGALVARRLAARGAEHLLLVGRRGPDAPGVAALRDELTATGSAVSIVAADLTDPAAVGDLVSGAEPPLRAVVHAAGTLDDGLVADLDAERLAAVWDPKAAAALTLDAATRDADLRAFVLFSSVAGVLPTAGQGNYAAANAALDALARRRHADGRPATALAWGPWAGGGMADDPVVAEQLRRSGVTPLDPDRALDLTEAALAGTEPVLAVTDVDWTRAAGPTPPPLIADLVPAGKAAPAAESPTSDGHLAETLATLPAAARSSHVLRLVRAETARVLAHADATRVDPDAGFRDLGLDSMTGVALRNALAAATGLDLPAGLVYDHPSVRVLATHLLEQLDGSAAAPSAAAPVRAAVHDPDDPIAIVSVACRLPGGVASPEDLWALLDGGGDAIGPFPDDRGWDLAHLDDPDGERAWSTTVSRGGFVADAAEFDAGLFGISPREALAMDPQQRLLLEVAWEAVERAGIAPDALRGTRTGIVAGAGYQGYGADQAGLPEDVAGHLLTGSSGSVVSGRLAYVLGTEGPAFTVDTACSSSLVAMHLAAGALRAGECDLALAGGVTVMSTPGAFVEFSRQGGLAGDGRCKAFSDDADGTGWAEGAGLVVLERLSDARAAGHPVLGILRGSAVNSDGASNGLTAPNGPSQQRVITDALAAAGLESAEVDAVEAHGTGTALGDPIEAQALLATYGAADRRNPLWVGSVKSNLGHTQAAAGAAGVIKGLLAMQHGRLPATLHAEHPTSRVAWSGAVSVASSAVDLPVLERPWRVGVSSFGISGSNAHVIVEAAPAVPDALEAETASDVVASTRHRSPLLLSGADDEAVRAAAAAYRERLDGTDAAEEIRVLGAAAHRRAALVERAVVLRDAEGDLGPSLAAVAGGSATPDVVRGTAVAGTTGVLLPGQGAQRLGMGRALHAVFGAFAEAFDAAVAAVDAAGGGSLREVMWAEESDEHAARLARTEWAQPALFVLQVAGQRLLESWGLEPGVLVGHSVGEIAAAHLSGALSLEDAARLVTTRGRLMGELPEGGAMAAVSGSPEVLERVAAESPIAVAARNSATSLVLSGDADALEDHLATLPDDARVQRLHTSHAFHSPAMGPAADGLARVAAELDWHAPTVPVVSTVTGRPVDAATWADPAHWAEQLTAPVRFAEAVAAAVEELDVTRVVEVGARPSLTGHVAGDHPGVTTTTLGDDGHRAAAELWASGAVLPTWIPEPHGPVDLPTYRFTHRRYWLTPTGAAPAFDATATSGLHTVAWREVPAGPSAGNTPVVVHVPTTAGSVADTAGAALVRLQQALADPEATVLVVTRGAVATDDSERPDPAQAAVRGLALAAAIEEPGRVLLVDLEPGDPAVIDPAAIDPATVPVRPDEPDLAVRGERHRVPRWVPCGRAEPTEAGASGATGDVTPLTDRPVVIIGGTGGVGAVLARHLAGSGARHLVLAGRRGAEHPDAAALRDALTSGDDAPVVEIVACDAADPAAVADLLVGLRDAPGLVVHAAGVLDDGVLAGLDAARLGGVLSAKLDAAHVLDDALPDDVELIALSSVAGTLGSAGQASYAAANAALDAWATVRAREGAARRSVVWGPWDVGGGMAARSGTTHAAPGLRALDPAYGTRLFDAARRRPEPVVVAAPVDPGELASLGDAAPAMWRDLPRPATHAPAAPDAAPEVATSGLAALAPADRDAAALELVRAEAAAALGHDDPSAIGPDRDFRGLGVDSLSSVALRNRLAARTGDRLPATVVFDFPTPRRLAAHLVARVGEAAGAASSVAAPRAASDDDPIAVVGVACRFPGGVAAPEDLWDLLDAGADTIGPPPTDRGWDLRRLGASVPAGGFLDDVAGFDAGFFGISAREALAMDPQQRLLLEASWEAVERAGIDPASLRGSDTGVFTGTNGQDYTGVLLASPDGADSAGGHIGTGNAASVLSGRVAYTLGTEGPAVTVDTACSASLVALHQAAAALRAGECSRALAGGVTVMSSPGVFVEFSRQGGLAADGRCKAFSDDADGTGWGEGVGVLVLERLSDARAAGHRVWAVLRGSAVNSDGASNGLTAPNGPAQQRVIRSALAASGLTAAEVDVVEAHGTGTSLGDPIEAEALLATYGAVDRPDPLWIRSVKSTLGHTQGAAGVAGVIAVIGALTRGRVPASPHVSAPSSHVAWDTAEVRVASADVEWPALDRPRRAGVSSFGVSGTNAHVVLEQGDEMPEPETAAGIVPLAISGPDDEAVRAWAGPLRSVEVSAALAGALAHERVPWGHRAVVLAEAADPDGTAAALDALAAAERSTRVVTGRAVDGPTGVVLPGQGSQRPGMGGALSEAFPVFAEALDAASSAVDAALGAVGADGRSLREVMWAEESDEASARLARTEWAQPALFVVQVAGFRLLESWGLEPGVLVGHSVGEIAAAHVAGALSLEDAARLVAARGQLMGGLPEGGSMAAVSGSSEVLEAIELPGSVGIAARNSASSVVLSGETRALEGLLAGLSETIRVQRLRTSHAFHSPLMAPAAEALAEVAGALTWHAPTSRVISTVTGEPVDETTWTDPQHWATQLTAPVAFGEAVDRANAARWVELGEKGSLLGHIDAPGTALGTDGHSAAATLWSTGATLPTWIPRAPHPVDAPTTPFRHRRYWPASPDPETDALPLRRISWVAAADTDPPAGRWIDVDGILGEALTAGGADVRVTTREGLAEACREVPDGVVATATRPADVVELVRAVGDGPTRLWVVTTGATEVTGTPDPEAAAVWGLGRTAALEHPDCWGGLIDLPADPSPEDLAAAAAALGGDEDQVAVRGGEVVARRLTEADSGPVPDWQPTGTVVVTGGSGALAGHLARRLAERGAERIVLSSRRGEVADDVRADVEAASVELRTEAVDAADATAVAALLDDVAASGPPLTTVVHAAGTLDDAPVADLDADLLTRTARPKAGGAAVVDAATRGRDVMLVVVTSVAGIWGGGSQGAYAAANAGADAVVLARRAAGERAVALAYGPWDGAGMAAEPAARDALSRRGLRPIDPSAALDALATAVTVADRDADPGVLVVADLDVDRFVATMTAARPSRLLGGLVPVRADEDEPADTTEPAWLEPWREAAAADRPAVLVTLARAELGDVLAHPDPARIDAGTAFRDLGLDSVTGVELRDRLRGATGLDLDATLVFDHPTLEAIAAEIDAQLDAANPAPATGGTDLVGDLDRLAERLRGHHVNGDAAALRTRLEAMLELLADGAQPEEQAPSTQERLADADDDALFAFIEEEIRR